MLERSGVGSEAYLDSSDDKEGVIAALGIVRVFAAGFVVGWVVGSFIIAHSEVAG
jgi:tetrahydromethanopterin S-methyltransferase subunit B